jgi:hypothetical protein
MSEAPDCDFLQLAFPGTHLGGGVQDLTRDEESEDDDVFEDEE